jgi:hypothetical protein
MKRLISAVAALVTKARRAVVLRQLAAVDNRQRKVVDEILRVGVERMQAQEEYAKHSTVNAARKRRLLEKLEKLDALDSVTPPPPAASEAAPVSPQPMPVPVVATPCPPVRTSGTATEAELRMAADLATCCHAVLETDPLDWPLPCDIEVGGGTIRRGVSLRTLAARVRVLHAMAVQTFPAAANLTIDPASANAELNKPLV